MGRVYRPGTARRIMEAIIDLIAGRLGLWRNPPPMAGRQRASRHVFGYWVILSGLIEDSRVTGPMMADAAIAALAIEHGATLCTTDRDFARFPSLATIDPAE